MKRKGLAPIVLIAMMSLLLAASCAEKKWGQQQAGGPATQPPSKLSTAREFYAQYGSNATQWSQDARLFYLQTPSGKDQTITDGKALIWGAHFYSPSKRQDVLFKSLAEPSQYNVVHDNVTWNIPDWIGQWEVDSPQAAQIATQAGLSDINRMAVRLRDFGDPNAVPGLVPSSCLICWEVESSNNKIVYVNAITGEVYKP